MNYIPQVSAQPHSGSGAIAELGHDLVVLPDDLTDTHRIVVFTFVKRQLLLLDLVGGVDELESPRWKHTRGLRCCRDGLRIRGRRHVSDRPWERGVGRNPGTGTGRWKRPPENQSQKSSGKHGAVGTWHLKLLFLMLGVEGQPRRNLRFWIWPVRPDD